jgi:hypothetical protein
MVAVVRYRSIANFHFEVIIKLDASLRLVKHIGKVRDTARAAIEELMKEIYTYR